LAAAPQRSRRDGTVRSPRGRSLPYTHARAASLARTQFFSLPAPAAGPAAPPAPPAAAAAIVVGQRSIAKPCVRACACVCAHVHREQRRRRRRGRWGAAARAAAAPRCGWNAGRQRRQHAVCARRRSHRRHRRRHRRQVEDLAHVGERRRHLRPTLQSGRKGTVCDTFPSRGPITALVSWMDSCHSTTSAIPMPS